MQNLVKLLKDNKLIPIIRAQTYAQGLEQGQLVLASKFKIIEITFTTPQAEKIIAKLQASYPEVWFIAGSILSSNDFAKALAAKVKIIVSPIFDQEIALLAKQNKILYIPGVYSPNEIWKAYQQGIEIVKLFPGSLIKTSYLKTVTTLFPNLKVILTGGVNLQNYQAWLKQPLLALGIGSNLFRGSNQEIQIKLNKIYKELYD